MSNNALSQMMDVGVLSSRLCEHPIQVQLAYATAENFIGRPINGYTPGVTDIALMTRDAAASLCQVQNELWEQRLGLCIYDFLPPTTRGSRLCGMVKTTRIRPAGNRP